MKHSQLTVLLLASSIGIQAQKITTQTGAPVESNQHSRTAGPTGAVLLEDIHLIEKLAAFDRERIPERVVHARGAGAHGTFVATADMSAFTRAKLFSGNNKETPVFVRFSTVVHGQGSPETLRDPRGFATKFYTEEGNYDLVGNNLPVFFIQDAMKFPDMVHAFKPSPVYNKQDPNRVFDFFSHLPEATHMLLRLYSDYGIPANYREMNGSSVHAFKWVNEQGQVTYVKYTWVSKQGERNLTAKQASEIQSQDFQHATVDLYQSIREGKYPSWDLYVQMLKPEDMDKFSFYPLDATKTWPEKLFPSQKIGTMTLNRIPANFFEEVEQSAFSPGTLVPGIEPSEDKLLQGRIFSYFDTQRYRMGTNFQQIAINRPRVDVRTNNQDGAFASRGGNGEVNYEPSAQTQAYKDPMVYKASSPTYNQAVTRAAVTKQDHFGQAGEFYRGLSKEEQASLVMNLTGDLKQVKMRQTQAKMVGHFYMADRGLGTQLATALGLSREEVESSMKP